MKIFVAGTRGIPDIPGGIEKHCQELYPRISGKGQQVILAVRSPYVKNKCKNWMGVKLINFYSLKSKSTEALIHTFFSLITARLFNPDIVHIHAIGPSLLTPLAKMLGFKVVVTNHGPEYNRQKWGRLAKTVLKLGEKVSVRYADEVIAVSRYICDSISGQYGRTPVFIPNGVPAPTFSSSKAFLHEIGVEPHKFILSVARFVPEKGLHDLVNAFATIRTDCKLVIAGDADHESDYSRNLKKLATNTPNVILTGYISGDPLRQLYQNARLFVLPSYHEGMPIVLLEAISYGLPVVSSDIPANKELELGDRPYFKCGHVDDLARKLSSNLQIGKDGRADELHKRLIAEKYNWDTIANQTIQVYENVMRTQPICPDRNSIACR